MQLTPWSHHKKRGKALTYLIQCRCSSGELALNRVSLMTSSPLKLVRGIWTHLFSKEMNGKDWRIICTQKRILAYALHAKGRWKVVLFVRKVMRSGWHNTCSQPPQPANKPANRNNCTQQYTSQTMRKTWTQLQTDIQNTNTNSHHRITRRQHSTG